MVRYLFPEIFNGIFAPIQLAFLRFFYKTQETGDFFCHDGDTSWIDSLHEHPRRYTGEEKIWIGQLPKQDG